MLDLCNVLSLLVTGQKYEADVSEGLISTLNIKNLLQLKNNLRDTTGVKLLQCQE